MMAQIHHETIDCAGREGIQTAVVSWQTWKAFYLPKLLYYLGGPVRHIPLRCGKGFNCGLNLGDQMVVTAERQSLAARSLQRGSELIFRVTLAAKEERGRVTSSRPYSVLQCSEPFKRRPI